MTTPTENEGFLDAAPQPASGGSEDEPFYEIWLKALTRPTERTYQSIVSAPGATISRAALWLFLAGLLGASVAAIIQIGQLSRLMSEIAESSGWAPISSAGALALWCLIPFQSGFQVAWTMFYALILHFVAGAFGGSGRYGELYFALASFWAPVTLLSGVLAAIPFVGACLTIPISLYAIYLNALVIKSVHRVGWGAAVVTLLLPVIVTLLLVVIIVFAFFVPLLGEFMQNGAPAF